MQVTKLISAFSVLLLAGSCAVTPGRQLNTAPTAELPAPSLENIADGVWIHKSYKDIEPWGPILSQGLVVETDAGLVLVDTAWDDEDTILILEMIEAETGKLPTNAVVTHAHEDKMGGIDTLHDKGTPTIAHPLTNIDAPDRGLTPAKITWAEAGAGDFQDLSKLSATEEGGYHVDTIIEMYHPGAGHTRDNIVVYHAPTKVLFGGCLIRPGGSTNLGNTADADIQNWATAVRNVAAAFPDAEIVIPSHGAPGGRELLDHTIALAEEAAAKLNDK